MIFHHHHHGPQPAMQYLGSPKQMSFPTSDMKCLSVDLGHQSHIQECFGKQNMGICGFIHG